jgi:hypothetical protein
MIKNYVFNINIFLTLENEKIKNSLLLPKSLFWHLFFCASCKKLLDNCHWQLVTVLFPAEKQAFLAFKSFSVFFCKSFTLFYSSINHFLVKNYTILESFL